MGWRYDKAFVDKVTNEIATMTLGIPGIEESTVYQDIIAKGRAEEAREVLLLQGRDKLGLPDEHVKAQIAAITDRDRLHQLLQRLLRVSTWEDLLASPDR